MSPVKPFVIALLAFGILMGGEVAICAFASDQNPQSSAPPSAASDAHKRGREKIRQACGDDVKRFCEGVKPGEGRIVQCLEQHATDLSQDCSELMQRRMQKKNKQPKAPSQ
ncbi:hypothetical protein DNFV4_03778 [Nitrospira tepida]|uniref:Cysteine rich repeat-containing protein n=1 Tax=Nitrospira tepida TaxID=2973512 RepID=A0AA86N256_9BACT|nr:hypothetical protein DNFV4_03778 [Nitrospira tepida]